METGERFNPHGMFNGSFIPEGICRVSVRDLSNGAKLLYGRLSRYAGKDGKCYPGRGILATELGCSVRQVDNYLAELKYLGLINTVRTGCGKNNEYYFLWHEVLSDSVKSSGKQLPIKDEESSSTDMNDTTDTLYKESHSKRIKKRNYVTLDEFFEFNPDENKNDYLRIVETYRSVVSDRAQLGTEEALIIQSRLQEFTVNELCDAIRGFGDNHWHLKNNGFRGIAWVFKDKHKVNQWLDMVIVAEKSRPEVVGVSRSVI